MSDFERLLRLEHELWRREARADLLTWTIEAQSWLPQVPAAHHRAIIRELELVAKGETKRLMIFSPPGSAKSTYVSKLFPAWWFALHPGSSIIAASHTQPLAEDFSNDVMRLVRDNKETLGYSLDADSKGLWTTTNRCRYLAAGVGVGIAGNRADIAIIDDPIRSRADADSDRMRDAVATWFQSDLVPRLRPDGRVVIVQTRWHEDDLSGRLLQTQPGRWKVLSMPAIAEEGDALGRPVGAALWLDQPGYDYGGDLLQKQVEYEVAGATRDWGSLYQQRPRPADGALFKTGAISVLDVLPEVPVEVVRGWDLASTRATGGRDSDWTAGVKLARMPSGRLVVMNVVRLRGTPDQVEDLIVNTARGDGTNTMHLLPQDPGSAGVAVVSYLAKKLLGYRFRADRETGDKASRAGPAASQVNVGNVSMMRGQWNAAFVDELAAFPSGKHDDQVDALSKAFAQLVPNQSFFSLDKIKASMDPDIEPLYLRY